MWYSLNLKFKNNLLQFNDKEDFGKHSSLPNLGLEASRNEKNHLDRNGRQYN